MSDRLKYIIKLWLIFFVTHVGMQAANAQSIAQSIAQSPAQSPAQILEAKFIGNEAFLLSDGDYTLMTDFPYQSGAYQTMTYDFNFKGVTGHVLSLITHRHDDHFAPLLFSMQNWHILGPEEVTAGLAQNRVLKLGQGVVFGPLHITPLKTSHGNTEHYSYLVAWHGRHILFTGDTDDLNLLDNLPALDALFITPWLYRKAIISNSLPKSKKVIIYHHREKDIIPDCAKCIIPTQNQIIEINLDLP